MVWKGRENINVGDCLALFGFFIENIGSEAPGNYLKGYALCRRRLFVSWDCHLGALVPRMILLESSISASRKTILTPRKQPIIHFNISCLFLFECHLGCSVPSFWDFGTPFLLPGSTEGNHLGTSRASWDIILAPRDHPHSNYYKNRFFVAIVSNDFRTRILLFFGSLESIFVDDFLALNFVL